MKVQISNLTCNKSIIFLIPVCIHFSPLSLVLYFYNSRSYLTRIFKETTGITVVQYLTVVRIRQAARLLRETDSPITEIADLCGFGNVTYFEKVFHRIRGMTPRQYRKNNR